MTGRQTTQDNANLAQDSYNDREPTGKKKPISIGGAKYSVLANVEDHNGYAGTIYQRIDTREIIVAHRGTENDRDLWTDAKMVALRANDQLRDAYALTEKGLAFAEAEEKKFGRHIEVTTIGHSLGGTLAQACAHRYKLEGEAFNPYGATSLGLDIPAGGHRFHNHVMATDPVSAASRHYGDVAVYAKPGDIQRLHDFGYTDREGFFAHGGVLGVAAKSFGAHGIGNFSNVDDLGRHHETALTHGAALASQHVPSIRHYRDDIYLARSAVHAASDLNPVEKIRGVIDDVRKFHTPDAPRDLLDAPDQRIFDRIRHGVPQAVNDAQVLQATADARTAGIRNADSIDKVALHNGAIFVTSDHTTGFAHSRTAIEGHAPEPARAVVQIEHANQRLQQHAHAPAQHQSHGMALS